MNYILLIIGFILLVKGADYFVDGASTIAKVLKIPPLIIGLTIVAFGTSAPEAAVSFTASLKGQNGMAMGNVIGSNIFNLLMVVGMSGFIKTLSVDKSILSKELPFLLLTSLLIFVLTGDIFFQENAVNMLTRADGIVLLMFFAIFMYSLLNSALNSRNKSSLEESSISADVSHMDCSSDTLSEGLLKQPSLTKPAIISLGGMIAIIIGGKMVVDCASAIASTFGVSDQLIGLTIVSIGTSLPEFVTSIIAATKGESDIALGNVIGSNMFNILFILGISAIISPLTINSKLFIDTIIMIISTALVYIFGYRKRDVNKLESCILILLYIAYIAYLLLTA
ncbi:sodium:calcium antiporter [Romboutsia maritimum]|uniref:Sodium:calcium antiporter n=1 Tax=Romboutsia maritimum TaxID=2020948 RepID=A0A371ISU7_9FIRM|nr:calcium/sodium antiporter [Romboutsia maritimum]RDY23543.1 sodium:calcium antiporter [Romboutsia maritimum]